MSESTIAEAKEKKHKLELFIAELLQNFSNEHDIKVESIRIESIESYGNPAVIYNVEIEATI